MVVHHPSKLVVPVRFWSLAPRLHRLSVRTTPFHGVKTGSIPVGATSGIIISMNSNELKTPKLDDLFKSIGVAKPYFFEGQQQNKVKDVFTEKYGTGINNIMYFENFLTEEEIKTFMSIANEYDIMSERTHCYPLRMVTNFFDKHSVTVEHEYFMERMRKRMIGFAAEKWNEKLSNVTDQRCMMMIHPENTYLAPHTDILDIDYVNNDPDHDEGPSQEEQLKTWPNMWSGDLAILAYINDDFEGGELYFPDFDYHFKPKRGSIVMFPGSLYYVHGVTPITKGTRYTLSNWCRFDFYEEARLNNTLER